MNPIVYAVELRCSKNKAAEFTSYEWATELEFKAIVDTIMRGESHVLIGGNLINVREILRTKKMSLEKARSLPSFQKYVEQSLAREKELSRKKAILHRRPIADLSDVDGGNLRATIKTIGWGR